MNILINKQTEKVEGINSLPTPFNYLVEVEDNFNPTKTIKVIQGEVQKKDEEGNLVFLKQVYVTKINKILVGRDEVLEDTGVPVIIKAQKENEEGRKLYFEPLYEGEEIIDYAEVVDAFDEDGTANEPVIVEVQKKSVGGKPLFYLDSFVDEEEEVLESEEEVIVVDEDPIEGKRVVITPVMIPNLVDRTLHFDADYNQFTIEEVLQAKYQYLLEDSQKDYILGDMFIDEQDLDLEDEKHSANTGIALLQLLAKGQAKTKTINLAVPTTEFVLLDYVADKGVEIYLSGKKFVDGKLTLASPISNCTIKFVNTTDTPKIIKSYAIGY